MQEALGIALSLVLIFDRNELWWRVILGVFAFTVLLFRVSFRDRLRGFISFQTVFHFNMAGGYINIYRNHET